MPPVIVVVLIVTVPPPSTHEVLPEPSVDKTYPFVPGPVGSVNVQADALLPEASDTELALDELYSFSAALVVDATPSDIVAVPVPFTKVKAASPPKVPALLN